MSRLSCKPLLHRTCVFPATNVLFLAFYYWAACLQLLHTAGILAAAHGKLDLVKHLVEECGVSAVDALPSHVCVMCESLGPMHDSDLLHSPSRVAALAHAAAKAGHIDILEYLKSKGARDSARDQVSSLSIALASVYRHSLHRTRLCSHSLKLLIVLSWMGVCVCAWMLQHGRTVLIYGTQSKSPAVVQYLIDNWDVDITAKNKVVSGVIVSRVCPPVCPSPCVDAHDDKVPLFCVWFCLCSRSTPFRCTCWTAPMWNSTRRWRRGSAGTHGTKQRCALLLLSFMRPFSTSCATVRVCVIVIATFA